MACWIASGEVLVPPTTSTSGMMCGGLKGCPTSTRSGRLHLVCITLGVMPDELDAMRESGGIGGNHLEPTRQILGCPTGANDAGADDADAANGLAIGHSIISDAALCGHNSSGSPRQLGFGGCEVTLSVARNSWTMTSAK